MQFSVCTHGTIGYGIFEMNVKRNKEAAHDSLPTATISCVLRADVLKSERRNAKKYSLALISTVFLYSYTRSSDDAQPEKIHIHIANYAQNKEENEKK